MVKIVEKILFGFGLKPLFYYCLEHYDEVKDIKQCNAIYKKKGKYFERDNSGNKFIKAFQLFKILINNIDKLIIPITLTEEVMRTQFYDKVDEYNTLEYTKQSYRLEKYEPKIKDSYKIFFDFETITSEKNTCHIYVGFTIKIYKKSL